MLTLSNQLIVMVLMETQFKHEKQKLECQQKVLGFFSRQNGHQYYKLHTFTLVDKVIYSVVLQFQQISFLIIASYLPC